MTSRPGSCCPSPAWSRSTTRWSTPTSTASHWNARRHISPERAGMGAEALLHAAVLDNARWCDAVCRSHGYPGEFGGRLWISAGHALPFYPNAITLSPDVTAAEATASQDPSRPFAIKDSFARLDLIPHGLTPLFDAEWIALPPPADGDDQGWDTVATQGELAQWEAAWADGGDVTGLFQSALLADPDCAILACHRDGSLVGGATTYTTDGVTGMLNVFKIGIAVRELLTSAVRAVAALRPGLPIVGYEQGEDLVAARAAGFRVLGPLRIWARGSAGPELGHDGVGLLQGETPGEARHRHYAAAAGQEDDVVGQAGAQVRVPFGDRDLLAQHGVLLGGHGRHHALLVGALDPAADRPADELRGRVRDQARHGVLDGVIA